MISQREGMNGNIGLLNIKLSRSIAEKVRLSEKDIKYSRNTFGILGYKKVCNK